MDRSLAYFKGVFQFAIVSLLISCNEDKDSKKDFLITKLLDQKNTVLICTHYGDLSTDESHLQEFLPLLKENPHFKWVEILSNEASQEYKLLSKTRNNEVQEGSFNSTITLREKNTILFQRDFDKVEEVIDQIRTLKALEEPPTSD